AASCSPRPSSTGPASVGSPCRPCSTSTSPSSPGRSSSRRCWCWWRTWSSTCSTVSSTRGCSVPEVALTGLGSRRRSRRLLAAGLVLVGALALVALAAPWLTAYDPDAIVVATYRGPLGPGGAHPLGTDTLGRDVWARLAYGARTSLFVGGLAMAVSLAIGMSVGLAAGYFGGVVDAALMWLVDLVLTLPSLLLLIVLATIFPPSILTIPLVIGAIGWTTFARTVR